MPAIGTACRYATLAIIGGEAFSLFSESVTQPMVIALAVMGVLIALASRALEILGEGSACRASFFLPFSGAMALHGIMDGRPGSWYLVTLAIAWFGIVAPLGFFMKDPRFPSTWYDEG